MREVSGQKIPKVKPEGCKAKRERKRYDQVKGKYERRNDEES